MTDSGKSNKRCPKHPRFYLKIEQRESGNCPCCDLTTEYVEFCPVCERQEAKERERLTRTRVHWVITYDDYVQGAHRRLGLSLFAMYLPPRKRRLKRWQRVSISDGGYIEKNENGLLVVYK